MNFFELIFGYADLFSIAGISGAVLLLGLLCFELFAAMGGARAPLIVLIGVPLLNANAVYNFLSSMAWEIQISLTVTYLAAVILGGAMLAFLISFWGVREV